MRSLLVVVLLVGCGSKPEILGDGGQRDAPNSRASLSITPGSADIPTLVTMPFTITNEGQDASGPINLVIMGTNSPNFLIVNPSCTTLSPMTSCMVGVMSLGRAPNAEAELHAGDGNTSASASLTSSGDTLAIAVPPISDTPLMGTSPSVQVRITNPTTTASGKLTLGFTDAEFAIVGNTGTDNCSDKSISPGGFCTFDLIFQPVPSSATTTRMTQITAAGTVSGSTMTMAKIVPLLLVDRTNVTAPVSTCAQPADGVVLTYTNPTALPLSTFSYTVLGTNASEVQIHNSGCTAGLAGGASCTLTVAPANSGLTGTKTVTVHVGATQGAASIVLDSSVTATFGCDFSVSPKSLDFGSVGLGSSSQMMMINVSNPAGSGTSHVIATALGGTNPNQFQITADSCNGQTISGGQSCAVQVAFKPLLLTSLTATVTISTPGRIPVNVILMGQGVTGSLTMTPSTNQFPPTAPTSISPSVIFTVKSTVPTGAINITTLGPFMVVANTCTTLAGPGDSCMVAAAFAPVTLGMTTSGALKASTLGGFASASLTGVGAAQLAISPAEATLVSSSGVSSMPQTFTIKNLSGVTSGAINLNTSGDTTPFTIGPGCVGVTLAPNATCTFQVSYTALNSDTEITMTFSATPGGSTPATPVYGHSGP